jgi:hypothetical protein
MVTLIRHGIDPLKIHAAIVEMEAEARTKLRATAVVCCGSRNTHDSVFNEEEKHEPEHISVETNWEKASPSVDAVKKSK